ncbi:MAG: DUF3667 domain-containing protein [Cyclobacteriaceae bacterium]
MQPSIKGGQCLNCQNGLTGAYCSACGQPARTDRITFGETIRTYLSSAFLIEGKYLVTIRRLITNPGRLYREYLGGKRASYYKPIAFFILNTAIYILIRALLDYDPLEGRFDNTDVDQSPDALQYTEKAARFMVNNINYILFTLVFAIGVSFKLLYRKRYYLAEYIAVGFYISGLYILSSIAVMLIITLTGTEVSSLQLLLLLLLLLYSYLSFIRPLTFITVLKGIAGSLISLALYMLFSFGLSFLFVLLGA